MPIAEITQYALLYNIGLIVIVSTVLFYIFRVFKQPSITAYIISGIMLGPFGFSLITNQQEIMVLSELGVAFLLFMVGVELDFSKLGKVSKVCLIAAILQSSIGFFTGYGISKFLNYSGLEPYYLGLAVAFSSTMVVVKILSDKKKLNALRGRISIGILLIQDIVIILALSLLSKTGITFSSEIMIQTLINGLGLVAISVVLGKFILPHILKYSADNRELFFLVCVATAFLFISLSSFLGFSIAIGGFIGGLALATYPFNVEIRNEILPLRDFFTVIFFTSLGMQVNFSFLVNLLFPFLLFLVVLVILKPIVISIILGSLGYGSKIPILVGLGLAQGSEFVFVLADQGMKLGHITPETYTLIISLILVSIAGTPYLHKFGIRLGDYFSRRFPTGFLSRHKVKDIEEMEERLKDHIILLGCDRSGGEVLKEISDHDVVVVDHNPEIIDKVQKQNYLSVYGEADSKEILERVDVKDAKMVVSTIPDFESNEWLIRKVKKINKDIIFITKANRKIEALNLYKVGADLVVLPERIAGGKISQEIKKFRKGKLKEIEKEKMKDIEELKKELS